MAIDANVSPLAKHRFLFANQLNPQTPQTQPARLSYEQVIAPPRVQRMTADFHNRCPDTRGLPEGVQKVAKGPDANASKGKQQESQYPTRMAAEETRHHHGQ